MFLRGVSGTPVKRTVTIQPVEKYPFRIIKSRAVSGEFINYILEEDDNADVKTYFLTVENLKREKGSYADMIELETDSKIKPKIKIGVYGNILPRPEETAAGSSKDAGGIE